MNQLLPGFRSHNYSNLFRAHVTDYQSVYYFFAACSTLFDIVIICRLNEKTGLLEPSVATFKPTDLSSTGLLIVNTFASLGLTSFRKFEDENGVELIEVSNYTIINLFLRMLGPTNEGALCTRILMFQVCCVVFMPLPQ